MKIELHEDPTTLLTSSIKFSV